MILLMRGCMLSQRKLFKQEVISFKRVFTYCTYSNVQKLVPICQVRRFSTDHTQNVDRELIYTGNITRSVRNIKLFSMATTVVSLIMQPFLYSKIIEDDNTFSVAAIFILLNFCGIVTPILLQQLAKRYVIEMYKHNDSKEEKYTAIIYTLFLRRKEITFTPADIVQSKAIMTQCFVRKHPLLFSEQLFTKPKYYLILMGYCKAADFEAEELDITPINRRVTSINSSNHKLPIMKNVYQIKDKVEVKK